MTPRPDWMNRAACRDHDPDLWFTENTVDQRTAKEICHACPVRDQCLTWALNHRETQGIWGGMTANQRRDWRTQTSGRQLAPINHGTSNGYYSHRRRGETPCQACKTANNTKARERRQQREETSK